jgi:deoxyribonuclease-4
MSRKAFIEEIRRSTFLNIPYIVFHPGSHMGKGVDYALKTIAESLDYCIENVPDSTVMLLLENTAGQGTNVGYHFAHLDTIIRQSAHPERLGVCLDTCHAFAAGYDLRTSEATERVVQNLDEAIGLTHLKVIHLNDTISGLDGRRDRHEHLGLGEIGMEGIRSVVTHPALRAIPFICETPVDERRDDRDNIDCARMLAHE